MLTLMVALAACSPGEARTYAEEEEFVRTVNVEVVTLEPTSFEDRIRVTGTVEAIEDVTVSAEETGRVVQILADRGQVVRRGQAILKLDDEVLGAQTREAEANVRLARDRYERQKMLWEEGIGTESDYARARFEAEAAEARVETLQARLAKTTVRAPISGVLDRRFPELGEMVPAGQPVARVVRVDQLKVEGGVPERFAGQVSAGDSVRVLLDLFPGQSFPGVLQFVATGVDEDSRTFPIEVRLERPGEAVKPKMLANVELPSGRLTGVLVVPQEAILRADEGYRVLVAVERDGHLVAESRPVRLGATRANRTVVQQGLEPGDRLIVRGHQLASPGDRVRIVAAHDMSEAVESGPVESGPVENGAVESEAVEREDPGVTDR